MQRLWPARGHSSKEARWVALSFYDAVCGRVLSCGSKAHRSQKARFATQTKDRPHDTKPHTSSPPHNDDPPPPPNIHKNASAQRRESTACAPS